MTDGYVDNAVSGHGERHLGRRRRFGRRDRPADRPRGDPPSREVVDITDGGNATQLTLTAESDSSSKVKASSDEKVFDPNGTGVTTGANTINLPFLIKDDSGSNIADGAMLTHHAGGDPAIGGLSDGGVDRAKNVNVNGNTMSLQLTGGADCAGSVITLDPTQATGEDHSLSVDGSVDGVGIGASFAINYVDDTTNAGVGNGATLTGANNVTISSKAGDDIETEASNGSEGAEAITPSIAITIANVTTTADIGTGSKLTILGVLDAEATQAATVSTVAKGDTKGATLGAGAIDRDHRCQRPGPGDDDARSPGRRRGHLPGDGHVDDQHRLAGEHRRRRHLLRRRHGQRRRQQGRQRSGRQPAHIGEQQGQGQRCQGLGRQRHPSG